MFDDHEVFLKSVRLFFTVSVLNGKWRKTPKIREFLEMSQSSMKTVHNTVPNT